MQNVSKAKLNMSSVKTKASSLKKNKIDNLSSSTIMENIEPKV